MASDISECPACLFAIVRLPTNLPSPLAQSSLNLTPEEKRAYGQLFQDADPDGLGVVTGEVAVKFFERTKLNPTVLGAIWQIGDTENRGLLTPAGFSVVLRLIGHAQGGREPNLELSKQPGPLPKFDNTNAGASAPIAQQSTGGPGPIRVPSLAPEKVAEYSSLFEKAGAQGGVLGGDAARQVFERARLPNEVLGQIWNLADTDQKGALNVTDFVVAMHFLTSMRSGAMRALPNSLPPGLYEAAARRPLSGAIQNLPRQFSGGVLARTQSPVARPFGSPISQQTTGSDWLVTPADKTRFDEIFTSIDTAGQEFVTGDQAVSFFSDSRLPEETLAQIWDLSDINSEGQLTRDEFAVAMFLIRQERAKKGDNRGALPTTLPPRLIPPNMRQRAMPPSQPTAPAFDNAAFASQQSKSAADDLFGLDALSGETSPLASRAPESLANQPASPKSPIAFTSAPTSRTPGAGFKPFIPTSSFGQGLASQDTGTSVQSNQSQSHASPIAPTDLLGDNDPEVSSKLTSDTSELANMSNQIGQLRTQMQEVQNKKATADQSLANTSNQKRDLETRLSQFRAQYEQEIREVKNLEERLSISRNDTRKVQQELAMVEGAHQDLLTQHQQLSASLEADHKENVALKQRMQLLNTEVTQLKAQVEKLKSEARQQKGLVAINKKQVATNEAEIERLHGNLNKSAGQMSDERPLSAQSERANPSFAGSPPAVSPGNNNPFFRSSPQQSFDIAMSPAAFSTSKPSPFDNFFEPDKTSPEIATSPTTTYVQPKEADATPESQASMSSPHTDNIIKEPPAPPRSRQITPSVLPLRSQVNRNESFDSSVRANAPASRSGLSDAMAGDSPTVSVNGQPETNASSVKEEIDPAVGQIQSTQSQQLGLAGNTTIPGAFPGDEFKSLTPAGGSTTGDGEEAQDTKSDLYSAFDSTELKQSPANGTGPAASEFPPIRDIEPEESDSEAEGGFDDDFDPRPSHPGEMNTADILSQTPPLVNRAGVTDPSIQPEIPPSAASQQPPPAYESAERRGSASTNERDSNQFPQQYHGLLPSREITNSPPEEVVQNTPQTIASPTNVNHIEPRNTTLVNGSLPTPDETPETRHTPVATPAVVAANDFDSAFDDLSEAKEETEAGLPTSTVVGDETQFNPNFASPTHSRISTNDERRASPPKDGNAASTSAAITSRFTNFDPGSSSSAHSNGNGPSAFGSASTGVPNDNSDWDAIFAGLDKPPPISELSGANAAFDVNDSGSSLQPPTAESRAVEDGSRPQLGRAISQGTEHDDPILKMLTNMGYSRDSALKALEKYDYNLDKSSVNTMMNWRKEEIMRAGGCCESVRETDCSNTVRVCLLSGELYQSKGHRSAALLPEPKPIDLNDSNIASCVVAILPRGMPCNVAAEDLRTEARCDTGVASRTPPAALRRAPVAATRCIPGIDVQALCKRVSGPASASQASVSLPRPVALPKQRQAPPKFSSPWTSRVDIFLSQSDQAARQTPAARPTHVVFPASSRSTVRDAYAAALNAGGRPVSRPEKDEHMPSTFAAVVKDLDGNKLRLEFDQDAAQEQFPDAIQPHDSNIVSKWADDVAQSVSQSVAGNSRALSTSPGPQRTSWLPNKDPVLKSTKKTGASTYPKSKKDADSGPMGFEIPKANNVVGALIGAAAGAALAYTFAASQRDSKQRERAFSSRMAARDRVKTEAWDLSSRSDGQSWDITPKYRQSEPQRDSGYWSVKDRHQDSGDDPRSAHGPKYPSNRTGMRRGKDTSTRDGRLIENSPDTVPVSLQDRTRRCSNSSEQWGPRRETLRRPSLPVTAMPPPSSTTRWKDMFRPPAPPSIPNLPHPTMRSRSMVRDGWAQSSNEIRHRSRSQDPRSTASERGIPSSTSNRTVFPRMSPPTTAEMAKTAVKAEQTTPRRLSSASTPGSVVSKLTTKTLAAFEVPLPNSSVGGRGYVDDLETVLPDDSISSVGISNRLERTGSKTGSSHRRR
ncbi:hypothetical protein FH972_022557 [Carpinus fangiana]|uniref:Uncharacterized protein n=1 Tax=Carpinus fangiana TaxID=176857 RepID=A0A5N6KSX2_9ROSI|nr:hypothetical protein FH972_022557 [Carpinus fangiana]